MIIRPEHPGDIPAIAAITAEAFVGVEHSEQTEPFIIAALRVAGALTLSLVAEDGGGAVGHVAFSPVTIDDGACGWFGLGPVSVRPDRQRQGIGQALIREGLARLNAAGAQGCVLVGDPGYYERFGFRQPTGLTLADVPPQYFLALPLAAGTAAGAVAFHDGFWARA